MQYRKLGRTDIEVSLIGLGTMTWGEQNTEAEAHEQLDYALDQGVNLIDAAEMYPVPPREETQGLTETYIGNWLAKRGNRDRVVLASKVAGPGMIDYLRGGPQLNREHIEQALNDSLRRLQTDYLDLYQVHWPARATNFFGQLGYVHKPDASATPIEETAAALKAVVESGRVRTIGISNETPWGFMEWIRAHDRGLSERIVSIQNPYNLLNRSFEAGLAEMAIREEAGLLAYSPLAFGMLSGKYLDGAKPAGARLTLFERFQRYSNESGLAATAEYARLAREHGLTPSQLALAFINQQPFVTSNLIGATTMEQLRENIATVDITLSDAVLKAIEAIHARYTYPCP
ncbi:NADP(H)-dependent aldo-keto reductase [Thioalkalivibrio thiocyanoxidans]|uniref:NADP(H)-dependent aldo-keto reductase n=1 Tax=Thioalkalivibrio thiocyanoxidans TaxID=152475 RepID=UPI0003726088|nr:NADP(H)-dependent aldo-keto reductase [Thioalkalivibrio thiocyanoxidans]